MIQARLTCLITKFATPTLLFAARPTARRRDDDRPPPCTYDGPSAVSNSEQASVRSGNMKEHYIRTLPKVVDGVDVLLLVLDAHDPAGSRSRRKYADLVPRESAQVALRPQAMMPFRSVGSHQRTILSSDSSLSPLGVVIFSNADKGGLIDTLKRVWKPAGRTKELLQYVQLERMLRIIDSPGVIFDNDEGIQGQNVDLYTCVTRSN
ncbi:hypothetical protein EDB85DRAFT_1898812 [Lactarius pseudohatsudake]|nr:hypothetical protein EDB85DRAFT_1898812 [Lactarius pseudohatsudake]